MKILSSVFSGLGLFCLLWDILDRLYQDLNQRHKSENSFPHIKLVTSLIAMCYLHLHCCEAVSVTTGSAVISYHPRFWHPHWLCQPDNLWNKGTQTSDFSMVQQKHAESFMIILILGDNFSTTYNPIPSTNTFG